MTLKYILFHNPLIHHINLVLKGLNLIINFVLNLYDIKKDFLVKNNLDSYKWAQVIWLHKENNLKI